MVLLSLQSDRDWQPGCSSWCADDPWKISIPNIQVCRIRDIRNGGDPENSTMAESRLCSSSSQCWKTPLLLALCAPGFSLAVPELFLGSGQCWCLGMELGQLQPYLAQPAWLPGRNNPIITRVFLLSSTGPGGFSAGMSRALTCHGSTELLNGLGWRRH